LHIHVSSACRDAEAVKGPSSADLRPNQADHQIEYLERLLLLRRLYRNCVRAEVYHRSSASAYVAYTDEELAEFVTVEDREAAIEARRDEAVLVLVDMQVVAEQIRVQLPHRAKTGVIAIAADSS
jgi:hypothetical protein